MGWQGRSVQFKLYFFYCSIVSVRVSVINTGSSIQVCILCSGQILSDLRLAKCQDSFRQAQAGKVPSYFPNQK